MPTALRIRSLFAVLVLCLCTGHSALAQMETATLSGVIQDPNGRVVPDVEVTATRIETGTVTTTKTNGAGIYFFTGLMPGHFHLMIRKPGFKEIAIKEFQLSVQDKLEQNFSLEVGSVSETVTVEAGGLVINTTDASVSTVIDRNFAGNLPLNGRSFNTLLQLTPGVVIPPSSSGSPNQFSIAGQRTDANNFTIDGVSANFGVSIAGGLLVGSGTGTAQAFSVLGGTSSLVSVDALQEFRVETSSFAPEFGKTPGGQVILTTRSGTNEFHGAAFNYFRNTVMDANNWFSNAAIPQIPRAPEHHNDFGGVLGGPIWKDKTFFFLSYEGARLDLPATSPTIVPFLNGTTCTAPTAIAPFLDAYPKPNGPVSVANCNGQFTGSYSNRDTLDAGSVRIDHAFSPKISIFGRYNDAPSQSVARQGVLSNLLTTYVGTQTLTVGLNMVMNDSSSNFVRGNYSQQDSNGTYTLDSFGGAVPLNAALLLGALSNTNSQGAFGALDTNTYLIGLSGSARTRQLNFTDDLVVLKGAHQLKFGEDYRAIFLEQLNPRNAADFFAANSVQGFLSNGQADLFATTNSPAHLLTQSFSLYGQDTWKITPKLTLTYGLRWELSPAPSARERTTLASWTNVNNPAAIALAPSGTSVWKTRYGNFAPRIGVAYSLTEKGDLVVRAGGGVFYDLGVGFAAILGGAFPNLATSFTPGVSLPVADITPFLPTISRQPPFSSSFLFGFDPNLRLPRSYQWNLALEKTFGSKQAISATYLGQAGRNLTRLEALSQPNANFAPGSVFQLETNHARSNYNALQLQYRRSLSSGLQALLNYSWSHSLDNSSDDSAVAISGTVISAQRDYASSVFDVRQSFSGALTYDVPAAAKSGPLSLLTKNWSLDTVIVARTGVPFNAQIVAASAVPGSLAFSRPDLVPGMPLWIAKSTAPGGKILNINAFSIPSTVRQGTEGRNDIPGFGLTQVDLSIGRKFPLTERLHLDFRADAFNLFNHPNFFNPPGFVEPVFGGFGLASTEMLNQQLGANGLSALFNEGGPRSLQLSLKFLF